MAHLVSFILIAILVSIGILCLIPHYNDNVNINLGTLKEQIVSPISECNLFSGKWIYDQVPDLPYKEDRCSFMEDEHTCQKNRRKDLKYQNWRWQPHHCDLPRFNGTAFLEKTRGKKLLFVGDSLMRNQWRSMLCLIDAYLPPLSTKSIKMRDNSYYFHSMEYNTTVMFQWAPFFVESNKDDIVSHGMGPRTVGINLIEKHGRHWINADVVLFDAFIWWLSPKNMTIMWGSFGSPDAIYKEVPMDLRQYEIVLNTWSEWLEVNINQSKTKIFFMSPSPFHFGDTRERLNYCYNQTEPILDETYWPNTVTPIMQTTKSIMGKLEQRGLKVEYINITQLSGYRKDAHPSIYRALNLSLEQLNKDPDAYTDCVHWCLPGVPDVWNQILSTYIMKS